MKQKTKPVLGYILKGYPRISETFISNEILRLEQQGFNIHIFPMRHPRESFTHESVKQIQADVTYLPTHLGKNFLKLLFPNIALAISSPSQYWKGLSLAFRKYSRSRSIATFKHLLQAGFMVQKVLNKKNIDHLHGHFAHSPTSVTMFAALLSNLPFSFTAHAKDIYTSKREQLREKLEKASFVVTCTGYNATYLSEIEKTGQTPIYCIYHGIDTGLFQSDGSRRTCSSPFKLFTVARLTEKKGLPTLYQALALLKKQGIDFQHTLIGDGDDREKILKLIDDLELGDNCRWLGTKTHAEVLDQFRKSDLFVLGCRVAENGDRDGIPNVLVESLAMGVPIVSTNVSAIPELIEEKGCGILVPQNDHEKMADAILELLTNQDLRRTIIETGQVHVRDNFDNRILTARLGDVFVEHFHSD